MLDKPTARGVNSQGLKVSIPLSLISGMLKLLISLDP